MDRTTDLLRFVGDYQAPLIATGTTAVFSLLLLAVISLGLPIWSMVIVVALFVYVFTVLHRPVVGLYFVVAVFFVPHRFEIGISLLQIVGGGTAALLLLWFLYRRRKILVASFMIPLLLVGPLILISFLYTLDAAVTLNSFRRWAFGMLFVLLLLNLVTTFEKFKNILWAILIMASINSIAGMIDYSVASADYHRSMGLTENANNLGHLAALAFPLALYQYIYAKGWLRWLGLSLCAVLAGGVVASVSRGALISVIVVFTAVMIVERRRLIPLLLIAGIAFSSIPLLPDYFLKRVSNLGMDVRGSLVLGSDRDLNARGHLSATGLRIWAANPIMGVGIGNYGFYFLRPEFRAGMIAKQTISPHNIYVQALSEMGVVGGAVLLWMWINSGLSLLRARRAVSPTSKRRIYFGAVEMMTLAILVSTAVSGSIIAPELWMFFGLLMIADRVAK